MRLPTRKCMPTILEDLVLEGELLCEGLIPVEASVSVANQSQSG